MFTPQPIEVFQKLISGCFSASGKIKQIQAATRFFSSKLGNYMHMKHVHHLSHII